MWLCVWFSSWLLQLLFSAENYVRHIRENLDYLHREVKSCLFYCTCSLILHIPVALAKCSHLCQGASSSGELSRASPYHPPQRITHGPFPQMSNTANKVRQIYFSIHSHMMGWCWTILQMTKLYFASFLCPCVILPKSKSEAFQKLEELNRKYQVGHTMIVMIHANSPGTYSSSILSACAARPCGIQPVRHSWRLHSRRPAFLQRNHRPQNASQWPNSVFH